MDSNNNNNNNHHHSSTYSADSNASKSRTVGQQEAEKSITIVFNREVSSSLVSYSTSSAANNVPNNESNNNVEEEVEHSVQTPAATSLPPTEIDINTSNNNHNIIHNDDDDDLLQFKHQHQDHIIVHNRSETPNIRKSEINSVRTTGSSDESFEHCNNNTSSSGDHYFTISQITTTSNNEEIILETITTTTTMQQQHEQTEPQEQRTQMQVLVQNLQKIQRNYSILFDDKITVLRTNDDDERYLPGYKDQILASNRIQTTTTPLWD